MKTNILILLALCFGLVLQAQSPAAFNYQGVAKNADGVITGSVGLQLSILQGSTSGSVIYRERHFPNTNSSGVFNVEVGTGTIVSGTFPDIDWSEGPYFLKTELDPTGGSSYVDLGTSKFVSVPYALYAETSGNQIWLENTGNITYGTGNVGIGTDAPEFPLTVESSELFSGEAVVTGTFTGTSSSDVIGVRGASVPADYFGIGGRFTGGYIGSYGIVNPTGSNIYYGSYGEVIGGTGTNYGVYGHASGGNNNYGGYFVGDARVTGTTYLGDAPLTGSYNTNVGSVGLYPNGNLLGVISNTTSDAGYFDTRGPNGQPNIRLSNIAGNGNSASLGIYDSAGNSQAGIYINSSGQGVVWGDIKDFRTEHPNDSSKDIWYASLEGPEAAAYERGTASLTDGETTVNFSEHFGLIANPSTMTVIITPLSADSKGVAVIAKNTSGFTVKELFAGQGNYEFDWEVKCVRIGFEDYQVIRDASEVFSEEPSEPKAKENISIPSPARVKE